MPIPSYLNPDSPSKKGRKQEKIAKQTINSGTLYFDPRDLKVETSDENYLVDVKLAVIQKQITLKLEDIEKFHKQAKLKTPVYLLYIGDFVIKAIIQRK
jgi:hypothetical protein